MPEPTTWIADWWNVSRRFRYEIDNSPEDVTRIDCVFRLFCVGSPPISEEVGNSQSAAILAIFRQCVAELGAMSAWGYTRLQMRFKGSHSFPPSPPAILDPYNRVQLIRHRRNPVLVRQILHRVGCALFFDADCLLYSLFLWLSDIGVLSRARFFNFQPRRRNAQSVKKRTSFSGRNIVLRVYGEILTWDFRSLFYYPSL